MTNVFHCIQSADILGLWAPHAPALVLTLLDDRDRSPVLLALNRLQETNHPAYVHLFDSLLHHGFVALTPRCNVAWLVHHQYGDASMPLELGRAVRRLSPQQWPPLPFVEGQLSLNAIRYTGSIIKDFWPDGLSLEWMRQEMMHGRVHHESRSMDVVWHAGNWHSGDDIWLRCCKDVLPSGTYINVHMYVVESYGAGRFYRMFSTSCNGLYVQTEREEWEEELRRRREEEEEERRRLEEEERLRQEEDDDYAAYQQQEEDERRREEEDDFFFYQQHEDPGDADW